MRFIFIDTPMSPIDFITLEEAMFQLKKTNEIEDTVFLCKPSKFILELINASPTYIGLDYASRKGYNIYRSGVIHGGSTSIVLMDNMWYMFLASGDNTLNKDICYEAWKFVLNKMNILYTSDGSCIFSAQSGKKIAAYGDSTSRKITFTNCGLQEVAISKTIKLNELLLTNEVCTPPDNLTSIQEETGNVFDTLWLKNTIIEYFNSIGIVLQEGSISKLETDKANTLVSKHTSEEWITYGRNQSDFI